MEKRTALNRRPARATRSERLLSLRLHRRQPLLRRLRRVHESDTRGACARTTSRPSMPRSRSPRSSRCATKPSRWATPDNQFLFGLPQKEAQKLSADLFEPQGNVLRPRLHARDKVEYLPERRDRGAYKGAGESPIGACYWLDRAKPYKARRIQVRPPEELPLSPSDVNSRITATMRATYQESS